MQLWQKSMEFYGGLQSNGRIESFEPVLLSAHGGDLNGYGRAAREYLNDLGKEYYR